MRLSVFYCIAFTFLGCLIIYIAFKLPEYLKEKGSYKYTENKSNNAVEYEDLLEEKSELIQVIKNPEDIPLEEAIKEREIEELSDDSLKSKLARRRRFLVFPDGSSFQVVFCTTYFTIIPIADIFYMGLTASLAWELPKDPYIGYKQEMTSRRKDSVPLTYKDVKGSHNLNNWGKRVLVNRFTGQTIQPFTKTYYKTQYGQVDKNFKKAVKGIKHKKVRRPPIFSKRSVGNGVDNVSASRRPKRVTISPANIDAMHKEHGERKYLDPKLMDHRIIDFHRISRHGLYRKLEKLIIGSIGASGKQCILKALCEVKEDSFGKQGTFLEEILRAVFTLHRGTNNQTDSRHYDEANDLHHRPCADIYSDCSYSIKSAPMR